MNKLLLFIIVFTLFSCDSKNIEQNREYNYPASKVWKHGVYSKYEARDLEGVFDGLEVDVIYSPERNDIYVRRVVADTSKNLPLDEWLAMLKVPSKMSYWVDFKNLSRANAKQAMLIMDKLSEKYQIKDNLFIESPDVTALKTVKDKGYFTMLWVENLYWWKDRTKDDTIKVMNMIRSQIKELQPDAISCEYRMFPLLCDTFPEQNIHFWDTPKKNTPENVEFTKKLCENESVKVVLVDYDKPIDY